MQRRFIFMFIQHLWTVHNSILPVQTPAFGFNYEECISSIHSALFFIVDLTGLPFLNLLKLKILIHRHFKLIKWYN